MKYNHLVLFVVSLSSLVCAAEEVAQKGETSARNNVSKETGLPLEWDVDTKKNIKWTANLGSITYGSPVVSQGKVFVATNNGAAWRDKYPAEVDLGCLLCFEEATGKFLWQLSRPKLESGEVHDWAYQGICSDPYVEKDRVWIVTNRCEVLCLDREGFYDGVNDGSFQEEVDKTKEDADIIWQLDMFEELGVRPRNMTACSITGAGELIFISTSNAASEEHDEQVPAPEAPSFLAVNKNTGQVVWSDNSPGANILHGAWSSPAYGVFAGQPQVIFASGDGWCYSFDPEGDGQGKAKLLWKFDCNPKASVWDTFDEESRNNLIATPVIADGIIYIPVGQDPEIGDGNGCLWAISPLKRGDVSPTLVVDQAGKPVPVRRLQALDEAAGEKEIPNPNSALVWKFIGEDLDQNGKVDLEESMGRALGSVAVDEGLLFVSNFSGLLFCLDAKTGKVHWSYDMFAQVWNSVLIADGHVYAADEDGDVAIFKLSADPDIARPDEAPLVELNLGSSIYSSPVAANGRIYISTANTLFAIGKK